MNIIFQQWWSTILPISTKRKITFHLKWAQKKDIIYGNPGPDSEQLQQCGGFKLVNLCTLTLCTRCLLFQF